MQECFIDKTKSSSATSLMSLSLVHYQQQRRNYNTDKHADNKIRNFKYDLI